MPELRGPHRVPGAFVALQSAPDRGLRDRTFAVEPRPPRGRWVASRAQPLKDWTNVRQVRQNARSISPGREVCDGALRGTEGPEGRVQAAAAGQNHPLGRIEFP